MITITEFAPEPMTVAGDTRAVPLPPGADQLGVRGL